MMYARGTTGILPEPGGDSFKRKLDGRESHLAANELPLVSRLGWARQQASLARVDAPRRNDAEMLGCKPKDGVRWCRSTLGSGPLSPIVLPLVVAI